MILKLKLKEYHLPGVFRAFKGDLVEFPDDEAKRRLKEEKGTWEKFEKREEK